MKIVVRLVIYIILLIISIYLMVVLFNLQKGTRIKLPRDYNDIIASGVLNIVTDYNSFGYFVSGDSISGFQHDMIKELERDWNISTNVFLENSLEDNLKELDKGKYDIVARSIPANTILKEKYGLTRFIVRSKHVLVQRKLEYNDSIAPIRQQLELAKKTIYVPKDSPMIMRLQNLSNEIGDTIYIKQNNIYEEEQLVMMVAGGDIDYTVCNEKTAKILAEQFPEIDIDTDISFTQLESWAVRKESPVLLDSLNHWLNRKLK